MRFVGGMRYRGANATWPFAELLVEDDRACVRLRGALMRRLLAGWFTCFEVRLDESQAEPVSGKLPLPGNEGIRLSHLDGRDGVIFWSFHPSVVLDALIEGGAVEGAGASVW